MTISSVTVIHGAAAVAGPQGPPGANFSATSSTTFTIVTGPIAFPDVGPGYAFTTGVRVRIASRQNIALNYMEGLVTSYDGEQLVVNVDIASGSGSHNDW